MKKVSRPLTIKHLTISARHPLYYYADKDGNVCAFRYKKKWYALNQFINRFGMFGFDSECKKYPDFIVGYDAENYYNPLLLAFVGDEKVQLYQD